MSKLTRFPKFMSGFVLVAVAAFALAACQVVTPETTTQEDSFPVPADYELVVDTFNGTIEVVEGSGQSVSIVATIRQPDDVDYSAELVGDTVIIVAVATRTNITPSPGVSLVITAPRAQNST
jgi:hypothetical protein